MQLTLIVLSNEPKTHMVSDQPTSCRLLRCGLDPNAGNHSSIIATPFAMVVTADSPLASAQVGDPATVTLGA